MVFMRNLDTRIDGNLSVFFTVIFTVALPLLYRIEETRGIARRDDRRQETPAVPLRDPAVSYDVIFHRVCYMLDLPSL